MLKVFKFSHFNLTKPQSGSQFNEYRVQCLSVNNFLARGGIHSQNSSTFTQKILEALKCQNSCTKIITENTNIETIIQIKTIYLF